MEDGTHFICFYRSMESNKLSVFRKEFCQILATLPPSHELSNDDDECIPKSLSSIFHDFQALNRSVESTIDDNNKMENERIVTPLMLACDKSQLSCLKYMIRKRKEAKSPHEECCISQLIGNPLDQSPDSGNMALHYGIMSKSYQAFYLLYQYQCLQMKENHKASLSLLKGANDHGDTPLMMMACQQQSTNNSTNSDTLNNHIKTPSHEVLESYIHFILKETIQSTTNAIIIHDIFKEICNLFSIQNKSGDTILSLAYGYGNYDLVSCLIQDRTIWMRSKFPQYDTTFINMGGFTKPSYQDIEKCKSILGSVDGVIKTMKRKKTSQGGGTTNNYDNKVLEMVKECESKRENIAKCLILLQGKCDEYAQSSMKELLLSNDISTSKSDTPTKLQKKNGKLKKKKTRNGSEYPTDKKSITSDENFTAIDMVKHDTKPNELKSTGNLIVNSISKPKFVTMEDGCIVSEKEYGTTSKHSSNVDLNVWRKSRSKSVDELLKERCTQSIYDTYKASLLGEHHDTSHEQINSSTTARNVMDDEQLAMASEEILESLCLDASMLLLTPHGMAMNLSPSQLEAIEKVLHNQLNAVLEAKEIHGRLLSKQFENGK